MIPNNAPKMSLKYSYVILKFNTHFFFISNLGFDSALKVVCEIMNLKAQSCLSVA